MQRLIPILFILTTSHHIVTPAKAGVHVDFGFANQRATWIPVLRPVALRASFAVRARSSRAQSRE
jgi:hypothetical protein